MKTRQLIQIISVSSFGQRVHFQFNLPRDAKRIISLHHSVRMITTPTINMFTAPVQGLFFLRNVIVGELRLQAFEKAGWFYSGDVLLTDRNISWGEYPRSVFFTPQLYISASENHKPLEVKVGNDTTVVNGNFKDVWGARTNINIQYEVKLYLEIELKTVQDDH